MVTLRFLPLRRVHQDHDLDFFCPTAVPPKSNPSQLFCNVILSQMKVLGYKHEAGVNTDHIEVMLLCYYLTCVPKSFFSIYVKT